MKRSPEQTMTHHPRYHAPTAYLVLSLARAESEHPTRLPDGPTTCSAPPVLWEIPSEAWRPAEVVPARTAPTEDEPADGDPAGGELPGGEDFPPWHDDEEEKLRRRKKRFPGTFRGGDLPGKDDFPFWDTAPLGPAISGAAPTAYAFIPPLPSLAMSQDDAPEGGEKDDVGDKALPGKEDYPTWEEEESDELAGEEDFPYWDDEDAP